MKMIPNSDNLGIGAIAEQTTIEEYSQFVTSAWNARKSNLSIDLQPMIRDLYIATVGLGGESGEVQELLKKHVRDNTPLDREELKKELGDVTYYVTKIGLMFGISLQEILDSNVNKLRHRAVHGKEKS